MGKPLAVCVTPVMRYGKMAGSGRHVIKACDIGLHPSSRGARASIDWVRNILSTIKQGLASTSVEGLVHATTLKIAYCNFLKLIYLKETSQPSLHWRILYAPLNRLF